MPRGESFADVILCDTIAFAGGCACVLTGFFIGYYDATSSFAVVGAWKDSRCTLVFLFCCTSGTYALDSLVLHYYDLNSSKKRSQLNIEFAHDVSFHSFHSCHVNLILCCKVASIKTKMNKIRRFLHKL